MEAAPHRPGMTEANRKPGARERFRSPSGRYVLLTDRYDMGEGRWDYSRGRVYRAADLDERDPDPSLPPIADVKRNYGAFPFSWIEDHARTGLDYLLCGADYQGQTFVDLSTGRRVDRLSEHAERGFGFCWVAHHPAPLGLRLAVDGCVWAGPYEVRIFDAADPMNPTPLARIVDAEFRGWIDDRRCRVLREFEFVRAPGHPLDGRRVDTLDEAEDDVLERALAERRRGGGGALCETQHEVWVWAGPDDFRPESS